MAEQELSYGQMAVGLPFNPAGDPSVTMVKEKCAEVIDLLHDLELTNADDDSVEANLQNEEIHDAITQLKTAQMWAVKAITRKL